MEPVKPTNSDFKIRKVTLDTHRPSYSEHNLCGYVNRAMYPSLLM